MTSTVIADTEIDTEIIIPENTVVQITEGIGKFKGYGSTLFMKKNGTPVTITAMENGSMVDMKNF